MSAPAPYVVFSDHARERYAQRVLRHDWRALPIDELVEVGDLRPATRDVRARHPDVVGCLVHRGAVFPLVSTDNGLLATTCINRWSVPKPDQRARREALRDDPNAQGGHTT